MAMDVAIHTNNHDPLTDPYLSQLIMHKSKYYHYMCTKIPFRLFIYHSTMTLGIVYE